MLLWTLKLSTLQNLFSLLVHYQLTITCSSYIITHVVQELVEGLLLYIIVLIYELISIYILLYIRSD